jgi:hypothetical protein
MAELARKTCEACGGSADPLQNAEIDRLHKQIEHWKIVCRHHLARPGCLRAAGALEPTRST